MHPNLTRTPLELGCPRCGESEDLAHQIVALAEFPMSGFSEDGAPRFMGPAEVRTKLPATTTVTLPPPFRCRECGAEFESPEDRACPDCGGAEAFVKQRLVLADDMLEGFKKDGTPQFIDAQEIRIQLSESELPMELPRYRCRCCSREFDEPLPVTEAEYKQTEVRDIMEDQIEMFPASEARAGV